MRPNGVGAHAMGKKNRGGEGKADKWGPLVSVPGGEQVSGPELGRLREVLGWLQASGWAGGNGLAGLACWARGLAGRWVWLGLVRWVGLDVSWVLFQGQVRG